MRTARFTTLAGLLVMLFLFAGRCRADQVLDLSGTLVTVGNTASNCNPNPCTIVTNFNFQITFGAPQADILGPGYYLPFTTTVSYTTLSSLGNSSGFDLAADQVGVNPAFVGQPFSGGGYLIVPGFPGEVDLDFGMGATADGTVVFNGAAVQWYSCLTSTCIQDFIPPQYQATVGPDSCYGDCAEEDASSIQLLGFSEVVESPEAPSLALFGFGGCLVLLVSPRRRSGRTRLNFR